MSDSDPECPSQFDVNWSPLKEFQTIDMDTNDENTVLLLDLFLEKPQDTTMEHCLIDLPLQLSPIRTTTHTSKPAETVPNPDSELQSPQTFQGEATTSSSNRHVEFHQSSKTTETVTVPIHSQFQPLRRRPAETAPNPEYELNLDINAGPSKSKQSKTDINANASKVYNPDFLDMTENDINEFINGQQNKNTLKKTIVEVSMFTKFLNDVKNENRELHCIPPKELDPLLANFILSKRKKDGSEYEPSSLRGIIGSIDRKLKRMKYGVSILGEGSKSNDIFNLTREALKAKQKVLKQQGKGNKPKRAQPITVEEINMLYQKQLLGNANPEALINTLWMNNTIHFGLRGVNEHYSLRFVKMLIPLFLKLASHNFQLKMPVCH